VPLDGARGVGQHGDSVDVPAILQSLVEDAVIDDVKARLMSGKEASVFVVERKGELLAAKVYKERDQRTFKATSSYTEGRNQTRNSRDKRAMGKRTSYGKELVEASWRDMEYRALHEAFTNGVRVPEPILLYENVLLMELLVDESGAPAPRLADFDLPADVAALLHREIYGQVRLLLSCGKIHGDLSAFNILIARDGPTIIDMPQVVDAAGNRSAPEILRRDLANVTEHLARFDSRLLVFRDCGTALWHHYQRGDLDRATEPEAGGIRRATNQGHRGRRARDAERGRQGRGNGHTPPPPQPARPPPAHVPPQHRQTPHPHEQRRHPPQQDRRPQQPQQHDPRRGPPPSPEQRRGPPDPHRGPPPQREQGRGAPPLPEQHRRPPQHQQERRPLPEQRRPPPPVERMGPQIERVPPSGLPPRDRHGRH
jgi:RIO kinase 1